jgi:hypothetical protein
MIHELPARFRIRFSSFIDKHSVILSVLFSAILFCPFACAQSERADSGHPGTTPSLTPSPSPSATLASSSDSIPADYFGMHWNSTMTGWPPLPYAQERLWDTRTDWADIETSPGVYKWTTLDKRISDARLHRVNLILTMGMTPTFYSSNPTDVTCHQGPGYCWPPQDIDSGNTHFKNFLSALLDHIGPGAITYWEGWNEPNNKPFWSGTMVQLVQMQKDLYQTVKGRDPSAVILMPPSFASFIPKMLSAGMGQWSDVNTFHGKTCAPESIIPTINTIKSEYATANLGSHPLWNTEGGWGRSANCSSSSLQVQAVARLYLLNWSQGIDRYYWYAYDNSGWGELGTSSTLNPAGIAYREVSNWMVGASGGQCSSANGVWICEFTRINPSGYLAQAVWTTNGTFWYTIPAGFSRSRDLAGNVTAVAGGNSFQIGDSPVLLETGPAF